jgi:hypothetical protein
MLVPTSASRLALIELAPAGLPQFLAATSRPILTGAAVSRRT